MIYLFRIFGYPLVLLIVMILSNARFGDEEKTNILCFFFFLVTVETLAAIFDFPFSLMRPRKRHG